MLNSSLIDLPWATLVTLASGYMGYFIANVGLKDHHKTIDITFATLAFSLLPALLYSLILLCYPYSFSTYPATLAAVISAVITGAFWRITGRKWMYRLLRKLNISWSDSTSSAWQQMFGLTDYRVTEVYVVLKDGSGLLSRLPGQFEGFANGPFAMGNNGDIILYVTHRSLRNSDEWTECTGTTEPTWGALATYIPSDQIARIDIRRVNINNK